MDVLAEVTSLIATIKRESPQLHQALDLMLSQIHKLTRDLEPVVAITTREAIIATVQADAPVVTFTFTRRTIRFAWAEVEDAVQYEIREGTSWDLADFLLRTSSLTADIDATTVGVHSYLIKSITDGGVYSETPYTLLVDVPVILALSLVAQVIDNNVLIDWEEPASAVFEIDYYQVYKDDVELARVRSSFFTRFEGISGTYTYKIIAVDIAGNTSVNAEIVLSVTQPPDYVIEDVQVSALAGTLSHMVLEAAIPKIVGPVNTTETWADHFVNNAWTTIQAQIDAGFPIYEQPSDLSATPDGYYEEVIDYGTTFTSIIATITWAFNQFDLADSVNIVVKMATSTDGSSYSSFTSGASQLLTNMRYLKFRLELTAASTKALMEIFNLTINLAVKRENDSGEVTAVSTDVSGTAGTFNKAFKDVDAVVASVKGTTSLKAVVNFVDVPNPSGFSVYIFNDAGVRQNGTVEWHARGIV